jgi:[methyl-Co(III) methanol-specific corrinoid protein]:coenzyme M methyltransferase
MKEISEKKRLLGALSGGEEIDRPPVICPGGMMNAAVTEVIGQIKGNHNLTKDDMVEAAKKMHELTGFENYGVPFCMTAEAEPFGVGIDFGDKNREPVITDYNSSPLWEIMSRYKDDYLTAFRIPAVLDAIAELKNDFIPVIGNITGAVSTATSVVDPLRLFKLMRRNPEEAYDFIEFINERLASYAAEMIKRGADLIVVSDPTATGEILGKVNFEKFAVPMFKKLVDKVHSLNSRIIIHICGDTTSILESLNLIGADAYSFDSIVNIKNVKNKINAKAMGNVNTQLLQDGPVERILALTDNCMKSGSDIIAPACGLGMSTPIKNLKAMTDFVKGE